MSLDCVGEVDSRLREESFISWFRLNKVHWFKGSRPKKLKLLADMSGK